MAGLWHPVFSTCRGGEPLQGKNDSDLPESGIADVALILGDAVAPRAND